MDCFRRSLIHICFKLHFEWASQTGLVDVEFLTWLIEADLLKYHKPILVPRLDLTAPYRLTFGVLVPRTVFWQPILILSKLLTLSNFTFLLTICFTDRLKQLFGLRSTLSINKPGLIDFFLFRLCHNFLICQGNRRASYECFSLLLNEMTAGLDRGARLGRH